MPDNQHWVGTWTTSPAPAETGAFNNQTLRMTMRASLGGNHFGLVSTKDGRVHRVVIGEHLGTNDGKITDITAAKIALIEIIPDGLGGYIERPAALALNE